MTLDRESSITLLDDKSLDILHVKAIYDTYVLDKEIVGLVAMNLSLRTSVYERDKEYSQTMVELLGAIATNPIDMSARWAVAKNPHTPIEVLIILSKDSVNLVRALVATNPSTPPKILEQFFNDEKIVRDALSANSNTPLKVLELFVHDSDKMVRMRLAENSSVSEKILHELSNDNDENVVLASKSMLKKYNER